MVHSPVFKSKRQTKVDDKWDPAVVESNARDVNDFGDALRCISLDT